MRKITVSLFAASVLVAAACGPDPLKIRTAVSEAGSNDPTPSAGTPPVGTPPSPVSDAPAPTATDTSSATATATSTVITTPTATVTTTGTATVTDVLKIVSVTIDKVDNRGNPAENTRHFAVTFSVPVKEVWWVMSEKISGNIFHQERVSDGGVIPVGFSLDTNDWDAPLQPNTTYRWNVTASAAVPVVGDQTVIESGEFTTTNFPEIVTRGIGFISHLDGVNGHFVWINADGSAQAFETSTLLGRKVGDSAVAVSVNEDGKVAWIQKDDATQSMTVYLETRNIFSNSGFPDSHQVWPQRASIAYRGTNLVWTMQMNATDGMLNTYWYDLSAKDTVSQLAINGFNTHELHIRGNIIAYITSGCFNANDLASWQPACAQYPMGWSYNSAGALNATTLVFGSAYMGEGGVSYQAMSGGVSTKVDNGPYPYSVSEGTLGVSDNNTVFWMSADGIRYQPITSEAGNSQLIAGATQFVVDGNTIYFVGPDQYPKNGFDLYQQNIL